MTLLTRLLPDVSLLHLDTWQTDDTATPLTLRATSTPALAHCPACQFPTRRIPSREVRTVADLPWAPWRVVLQLRVRTFFCVNGRGTRRMFTERWPGLVAPWARRTRRRLHGLASLAFAPGGTAGARLRRGLGRAVSRHTLLRLRRRLSLPELATPQVLGVGDWASRTRQTYGTVFIALERHRPLARWPDREAATLAPW